MPKIEVSQKKLHHYVGAEYSLEELEAKLVTAKAELDDYDEATGMLKIELNDTNRPDLWSAPGIARQLRVFEDPKDGAYYPFFSVADGATGCADGSAGVGSAGANNATGCVADGTSSADGSTAQSGVIDHQGRVIQVEASAQEVRPYVAAFAVKGYTLEEDDLDELIQIQEKLCHNFGRRRKSISMGIYRSDLCQYPIHFKGVDPDTTSFVPLGEEKPMTLRQINKEHPKGVEYGHIVEGHKLFPLMTDATGKVLSYPPVINSADLGAVEVGDSELFIELSGTVQHDVVLGASIIACDMADMGFEILPVRVEYDFETPLGSITTPYYFQKPVAVEIAYAQKLLGIPLEAQDIEAALGKMGVFATSDAERAYITVPEYRNDFLHPVDIIEDIMIGRGLSSFDPLYDIGFTVGRVSQVEAFSQEVQRIMVGMGFQEMMYNYLGSEKDYITKMEISGDTHVHIANPMTENYEYVRESIIPALLQSESVSANAVYPHNIFETGKVATLDSSENSGTTTKNYLGFLSANHDMGFTKLSNTISALLFYVNKGYQLEALEDPRFISGRAATVLVDGKAVGFFGEVHPKVLENWNIQMPTGVCEIDLDGLL